MMGPDPWTDPSVELTSDLHPAAEPWCGDFGDLLPPLAPAHEEEEEANYEEGVFTVCPVPHAFVAPAFRRGFVLDADSLCATQPAPALSTAQRRPATDDDRRRWTRTAELLDVINQKEPIFTVPQGESWREYLERVHSPGEPDEATLERWAMGDVAGPFSAVAERAVPYAAWDVGALAVPTGWYCQQWDDLTPLWRVYAYACVAANVEEELVAPDLAEEEPYLPTWSFQFLLVALLGAPDFLRTRVRALLARMGNLRRWHNRYVFSGGFLRESLRSGTHARVPDDVRSVWDVVWQGSDGVAFYEHVQNFDTQHAVLQERWPVLKTVQRGLFDDARYKIDMRLLEGVDRVTSTKVYVKYRGCPEVAETSLACLPREDPLWAKIHHWQQTHTLATSN